MIATDSKPITDNDDGYEGYICYGCGEPAPDMESLDAYHHCGYNFVSDRKLISRLLMKARTDIEDEDNENIKNSITTGHTFRAPKDFFETFAPMYWGEAFISSLYFMRYCVCGGSYTIRYDEKGEFVYCKHNDKEVKDD